MNQSTDRQQLLNSYNMLSFLQNDTCIVDGKCYYEGDYNTEDCCRLCQPQVSTDSFTKRVNPELPEFSTSQTTHVLTEEDNLNLDLVASDPSGCELVYDIKALESNLFPFTETTMTKKVQIQLHRPPKGKHTFTVKARNKCGYSTTLLFKIVVLKVKTAKFSDPSSNCIGMF